MTSYQSGLEETYSFSIASQKLWEESPSVLSLLLPDSYLSHSSSDQNTLKIGLTNYFLTLSICQDALESFLYAQYRKFDALVGNNSCYSSAYIIFLLAQKMNLDSEFRPQLILSLKKIQKLKDKISSELYQLDASSSHNFQQFLRDKNLLIDLELDVVYLGLAYACASSKQKNSDDFEEIHYENLLANYQKKVGVELKRKSVIKLIKHWQKILAELNVKALQYHAKFTSVQPWTKYLYGQYILTDERNRLCTPSFYALKAIYDLLLSIPQALIGLQVNLIEEPRNFLTRFTLFYEVQADRTLKVVDPEEKPSTTPVYMFTGCRYLPHSDVNLKALRKEFSQRDLEELIFAHEATYPQYPNSLKAPNILPDEPALLQEILRLQKLKGFSIDDPSDLCLVHIFVDDVQSQSLAMYEPAVYLPNLSRNQSQDEASCQADDRRIEIGQKDVKIS